MHIDANEGFFARISVPFVCQRKSLTLTPVHRTSMTRIAALLAGIVLLASGCDLLGNSSDGSSGELRIVTVQETYSPGQKVAVRLDNDRSRSISYHRCGTILQRKTEGGWEVHSSMICTPIAQQADIRIDAKGVVSDSLLWFGPGDTTVGKYRFELDITNSNGDPLPDKERLTNAVTVERD